MRSTTIKTNEEVACIEQQKPSEISRGLRLATDILIHARLPRSYSDELEVIGALDALLKRVELDEESLLAKDELFRSAELLTETDIRSLIDWIKPKIRARNLWSALFGGRRNRHMLLLAALARIVTPVNRFVVVQKLDALGLYPNRENVDGLLRYLPRRILTKKRLHLATAYLNFVQSVWFPVGIGDRELIQGCNDWSAYRILLEIKVRWNQNTNRPDKQSLAVVSGTAEFHMAYSGRFGALANEGGTVVRRELRQMDYHDTNAKRSVQFPKSVPMIPVFLVLTLCLVLLLGQQIKSVHSRNISFLERLETEAKQPLEQNREPVQKSVYMNYDQLPSEYTDESDSPVVEVR